jgi:hypothetical protein
MVAYNYIQKRDTGYYYRQIVPLELRSVIGKKEIIRSLKTKDIKTAKYKARHLALEILHWFDSLINNTTLDISNILESPTMPEVQAISVGALVTNSVAPHTLHQESHTYIT